MKKISPIVMMPTFLLLLIIACQKRDSSPPPHEHPSSSPYYVPDVTRKASPGKTLLNVSSYQQTTEYSCGPAGVVSLLHYLGKEGDEMT